MRPTAAASTGQHLLRGTQLPAFAAAVPDADAVVVWVIAESYEEIAVRHLYDVRRDQRFGG